MTFEQHLRSLSGTKPVTHWGVSINKSNLRRVGGSIDN
jgi:hypothetical protein